MRKEKRMMPLVRSSAAEKIASSNDDKTRHYIQLLQERRRSILGDDCSAFLTTLVIGDTFIDLEVIDHTVIMRTSLHDVLSNVSHRELRLNLFNKTHALNQGTTIQWKDNQLWVTAEFPASCLESDGAFEETLKRFLGATSTAIRIFEKQFQAHHATTEHLYQKLQDETGVRDCEDDHIVHDHHFHPPRHR